MLDGADSSVVAAALILLALVVLGPSWATPTALGDGTAEVDVLAPTWLDSGEGPTDHVLRDDPGRFGTDASYLRSPPLVVDVSNVSGSPELYYDLDVPALDLDTGPVERRLSGPGRYRLELADVAVPPADYRYRDVEAPDSGVYTGIVTVRVQSFSGQTVVANRTVGVRIAR